MPTPAAGNSWQTYLIRGKIYQVSIKAPSLKGPDSPDAQPGSPYKHLRGQCDQCCLLRQPCSLAHE